MFPPPPPQLEVVVCEGRVCASPSEPAHRCPPPTALPWPLAGAGGVQALGEGRAGGVYAPGL